MKLILMLQQSNKRLTVGALAEKFNVSERTIYRDFNALSDLNVPVTWDKYQGYGIVEGYSVPPLMFTSKELAVIMVGLNFVKSQVDNNLVEDAEGVALKIKEILPAELRQFMESIGERTMVDPYLNFGSEKKSGGNWYEISNAIANNKILQFDYLRSSDNQITVRRINPYLMVFYGDHWNLIGYSHKRDELRNFILNQISNIQDIGKTFTPQGIDIEPLIYRIDEGALNIEIKVGRSVYEQFKANLPAKIEHEEDTTEGYRIIFKFDNLDYINKWLLQFADKVEVLEPNKLTEKRNALLEAMLKNE